MICFVIDLKKETGGFNELVWNSRDQPIVEC